jgi:hypothetical protein
MKIDTILATGKIFNAWACSCPHFPHWAPANPGHCHGAPTDGNRCPPIRCLPLAVWWENPRWRQDRSKSIPTGSPLGPNKASPPWVSFPGFPPPLQNLVRSIRGPESLLVGSAVQWPV